MFEKDLNSTESHGTAPRYFHCSHSTVIMLMLDGSLSDCSVAYFHHFQGFSTSSSSEVKMLTFGIINTVF